jgi:UDP:flavonoid glycosyltransferase YjiC (YdhE family)
VLPRCTAIVHHGGIGTTSQALATGTPQLIMPMAHDQPDNAQRVARLGAGSYLWPSDFNASNLAKALAKITGDTVMRSRCAEIKSLIDRGETARKLLTVLSPHLGKITS